MWFILLIISVNFYYPIAYQLTDKEENPSFLYKQKFLLEILQDIHNPLLNEQYKRDSHKFIRGEQYYTNYTPVVEFFDIEERGLSPQNALFSVLTKKILREMTGVFSLLYYSKDWDTFYKNTLWAREHVNEEMFVYALNVAVQHHPDFNGIILPNQHEIFPYLFYPREVMEVIPSNYQIKSNIKNGKNNLGEEQLKLKYFTEDVAWNLYNFYFHIDYPNWLPNYENDFDIFNDRRGELYLHWHQQCLARYYLERLSVNLSEISDFDLDEPFRFKFSPDLWTYDGIKFADRNDYYQIVKNSLDFKFLKDLEKNLNQILNIGYINLSNGSVVNFRDPKSLRLFGNIIKAKPNKKGYVDYATILKRTLVRRISINIENWAIDMAPNVLEHNETAMRDPAFYQLLKRVLKMFSKFKDLLPTYTKTDLNVPHIKLVEMNITKLETYFDEFETNINGSLNSFKMGHNNIHLKIKQKRLNHKPFTVSFKINSEILFKKMIAVQFFIGPKQDSNGKILSLEENRDNFIKIDQFLYNLPYGESIIHRNSKDFYWSIEDPVPSIKIYQKVLDAIRNNTNFNPMEFGPYCGYPDRLILPTGWAHGMPIQFFAIISDVKHSKDKLEKTKCMNCCHNFRSYSIDDLPFGYPFNRAVNINAFEVDNVIFKDSMIYHLDSKF